MTMERFQHQRKQKVATVTIRRNGSICINSKGAEEFNLEGLSFATLHHDVDEPVMGIKPTSDDKDPSAFRVFKGGGRGLVIYCPPFLEHLGIPYKRGSKVYLATWNAETAMILVKFR